MSEAPGPDPAPGPGRLVEVGGGRLYVEVAGRGSPVVLLHAGGMDSRIWDPQWEAFAERHHVIRYDFRGFGRSDVATHPYSDIDDFATLMRSLGVERPALVGLSMGGRIAMDLALAHPGAIRGLLLAACGPGGLDVVDRRWEHVQVEARAAVAAGDLDRALELESAYWIAPEDPAVDGFIRRIMRDNAHLYLADESLRRWPDPPAFGRLDQIRVPTLVVEGGRDLPLVAARVRATVAGIPAARHVVIEGADHMINLRRPAEFNRHVLRFLRDI